MEKAVAKVNITSLSHHYTLSHCCIKKFKSRDVSLAVAEEEIYIVSTKTRRKQLESGGRGQYCCVKMLEALESETCYSIENDINFQIDCPKEVVVCGNCQNLKEQLNQLKKENDFLKNENLKLTKVNSNINDEINIKNKNEFNYESENCEFLKFYDSQSSVEKKQKQQQQHRINAKKGPKPKLSALDQFFMTLVYFKNGFALAHIGWLFKLPKTKISRQIISWINHSYFTLGRIPTWHSREQIDLTMPEFFKRTYPKTKSIIDCNELFSQILSSLNIHSSMNSSYKRYATYKGF
ncbi:uncharacterized protein LOC136080344 [Hydra vulgaris]|uniref:Uncharacterized protein LOC136080344 n=1 Tax=Hydra vulgaris TaxID=6087 RepID=A0ABM4BV31_HYDVU